MEPTIGTARDLRARVILALIATRNGKPNGAICAAALMETARTIMTFITGEPEHDPVPEAANDTGRPPGRTLPRSACRARWRC